MKSNRLHSFFLILTSLWLGWTVLVDMVVVPTIFKIVDNFFNAGDLGIALFSKLNHLELVISSALLSMSAWILSKKKTGISLLLLTFLSWAIVMFYFMYLTPKLISLTEIWKEADLKGLVKISGLGDVQQTHQFYHRMYVTLDVIKLSALSFILGFLVFKEEKWN